KQEEESGVEHVGPSEEWQKAQLRARLREELEIEATERETALRSQATDLLEAKLRDLRTELDQVVNRVTAEALKRKAAQLGRIKELSEDPETGSLTIVLEV